MNEPEPVQNNINDEDAIELQVVPSNSLIEDQEQKEQKENTFLSDDDVPFLNPGLYILIYISFSLFFIILSIITHFVLEPHQIKTLIYQKIIIYSPISILIYLNGKYVVGYYEVKVNYTRKFNHILGWLIPYILDIVINFDDSAMSSIWNGFFFISILILWMKPTRAKDPTNILNMCYKGIDRPEDRPNTLKWMMIQNMGLFVSLIPFIIIWDYLHIEHLIIIPLLILTFGDGLAEPVGIRFGKHKYKVYALCTNNQYQRSYEGSFVVYLSGIIIISILYQEFELIEFILNLIIVPVIATLTEAYSPHTLDNPLIIITVSVTITIIHLFFK